MIIEMAPPPRRDGPVDLDEAWRHIQVALAEMQQAADNALAASAPMNLLLRVFRTQAEATSTLVFAIARCEREAIDKLQQMTRQTDAVLADSRRAASYVAAARVLHVALNLVFVLGLVALAIWSLSRPAEPPFEVEFNAADHGQIDCGAASRDASGEYHCTMRIVLKPHRQKVQ